VLIVASAPKEATTGMMDVSLALSYWSWRPETRLGTAGPAWSKVPCKDPLGEAVGRAPGRHPYHYP